MGVAFWSSSNLPAVSGLESGPGVYVVLSGVIRRLHQHLDGTVKVNRQPALRDGHKQLLFPCRAALFACFVQVCGILTGCPCCCLSRLQEYFQGTGGVVGSLLALTGAWLP